MVAEIIIVSSLFLVSASIRGLNLSTLAAGPDELTYLSRAVVILGDNWQWPKAFMTDQPPLFIYVLAIVVGTIGASLETLRWVSVLAGSVAVVIVYLWAKSMFDRKAGLIAAIALAFNGFDILYSRQIYIESLVLMFLAASAYLFWEGVVKRVNTPRAILSGVFLGLALDTKYIGAVLVVALLVFTIIYW